MESLYKRMDIKEFTEAIVSSPVGTIFTFGLPEDGNSSPPSITHDEVDYYYGCYIEDGRLDNAIFVIDHFGGGNPFIAALNMYDAISVEDKHIIELALTTYLPQYVGGGVVYVATEHYSACPPVETDRGVLKATPYDDGMANGIHIWLGDEIIAAVDVHRKTDEGDTPEVKVLAYKNPFVEEPDMIRIEV